jgi:signal-transduction protein with cAMP-binding, CBS, and nucleotidyltransferase domain
MSRPLSQRLLKQGGGLVFEPNDTSPDATEGGSIVQVRDGMTEVVLELGPAHTLREAAQRMSEKGIGAALVVDDEDPVPSIITERDVLNSVGKGEDPDAELVRDHKSEGVVAAAPDWSLERAASEMSSRGIRHLVVFDGPDVSGILSMRDIVRVWTSAGATSAMTPD